MTYEMKKASKTWMNLGTMLMLYLIFILAVTGCGKQQVQYLDFPEEMAGQWRCESGTLEDPSDYVGYFFLNIEEDGTFSMYDIEAGNPGIAGKMNILSAEQLQFSDMDEVDFDPPHSWQSMAYDQIIAYKMEGNDELYLSYTDEKTENTSTLVFHREVRDVE